MKKILVIFGIIIVGLFLFWKLSIKPASKALSPSPTTTATCQALTIVKPQPNETVSKNFSVAAVVDNRNPKCHWSVFEAQAGAIEVKDSNGQLVGNGVLKTTDNWMTSAPVTYSGDILLNANTPHENLIITINEENPNGIPGKTVTLPVTY